MNDAFQQSATSAINKHVTCRNWLNGYYIVHYEQNGSDRAKYGENLLQNLANRLKMKGFSYRDLRLYRQFFLTYKRIQPAIVDYILKGTLNWQSAIANLDKVENWQSVIAQLGSKGNVQSLITRSNSDSIQVPADKLFNPYPIPTLSSSCLSKTRWSALFMRLSVSKVYGALVS